MFGTISSHQRRCRRYHSLAPPSVASVAPSSACSTAGDVDTFVMVAETCHRRRSMHRMMHCRRSKIDSVDRWCFRWRCLHVSICTKDINLVAIRQINDIYILCSPILKPGFDLPIAQTQLHRQLPSVLRR